VIKATTTALPKDLTDRITNTIEWSKEESAESDTSVSREQISGGDPLQRTRYQTTQSGNGEDRVWPCSINPHTKVGGTECS
jgi:hypothetical protein